MDVSVVIKPMVFADAKPGMCILFKDTDETPVVALVISPLGEQSYNNLLPIFPAHPSWSFLDGHMESSKVFAYIENAFIRPADDLLKKGSSGKFVSIPPGALVVTATGFLIAGSLGNGGDTPRLGYDPETGATRRLEGALWYDKWAVYSGRWDDPNARKICDCTAMVREQK